MLSNNLLNVISSIAIIYRDQPIMLIFLPIMLCSSAQIFDLLCSILCSCKTFVLKNLAVLLEYIHLHHKNFNVVLFY